MKDTPENRLKEEIKKDLSISSKKASRWPGLRLFSNPRGTAHSFGAADSIGRLISYGLAPGNKAIASSDFIGWKTVTITSDMVGHKIAQFFSIETKAPGKKPTPAQQNWLDIVNKAGGIGQAIESTQALDALIFAVRHQYESDSP